MTDGKTVSDPDIVEPFMLRSAFPDAQGIFDYEYLTIEHIKNDCFVALDANVLLLPYKLEDVSLSDVTQVYKSLAGDGRLVIPSQAAREFASLRSQKIAELVKYLREQASLTGPLLTKKIGALVGQEEFEGVKAKVKDLTKQVRELQQEIQGIAEQISAHVGADPVSVAYRELFKGTVREQPEECNDQEAFLKELRARYASRRPPGYKDERKPDGGSGDLIIWKTILAEGQARKSNCIFVTGDQKQDWYAQLGGAFQPRLELLEEYRLHTDRTLHIVPLSKLLRLFEASPASIESVRLAEVQDQPMNEDLVADRIVAARSREYAYLQRELERLGAEIDRTESFMAKLPSYDGNMSLPWNREYQRADRDRRGLIASRLELQERIARLALE